MIYLNIIFKVRNSKDQLANCIKQNAKEQFRTAVILSGTSAVYQKATTDFVVSVCLHGTTQLPLDGSSRNLVLKDFSKICREKSSFLKILQ